jgi:hypothetical protein
MKRDKSDEKSEFDDDLGVEEGNQVTGTMINMRGDAQ